MKDIYEVFLYTLSASFPAIYVLIIKTVLKDKLTPLWQFSIWAVFAASLLYPFNIPSFLSFLTETVKTFLSGTVSVSKPVLFIPIIPLKLPETAEEYIYSAYFCGFVILLLRYVYSAIKLRLILKKCPEATDKNREIIENTAKKYKLTVCPTRTLKGLSSPFVCGIIKPVLVLPEEETDEKIILHELLHLKYKDVLWGIPVAVFRCIHWCNPLLWYCFNKINNDIEELCDSRVISLLDGEERRAYGNIILSMANQKYASLPGTSSIANGGKNIRSRIETIARFKQYPQENALVSICIIILLASCLFITGNADTIPTELTEVKNKTSLSFAMSAARSYYCTTPAGAIDNYAYSVMQKDGIYRAISAPLELHKEIKNTINEALIAGTKPDYCEFKLNADPHQNYPYYIYNLTETDKNQYTAVLAFRVYYIDEANENNEKIAYQKIRIFKEGLRWVVLPESDFEYVITYKMQGQWGCEELPCFLYTENTDIFTVNVKYQTYYSLSSSSDNNSYPRLNAYFSEVFINNFTECVFTGNEVAKGFINQIGLATATFDKNADSEITSKPIGGNYSSSSSDGSTSSSVKLRENWNNTIHLSGGGHSTSYTKNKIYIPEQIIASLYVNGELYQEMLLERKE